MTPCVCADPRYLRAMTMPADLHHQRLAIHGSCPCRGRQRACLRGAGPCLRLDGARGRHPNTEHDRVRTLLSDGVVIKPSCCRGSRQLMTRDHAGSWNKAVPLPHDVPVDLATMNFAGRSGSASLARARTGRRDAADRLCCRFRPGRNAPRVYAPSTLRSILISMRRCRRAFIQTPARFPGTAAVP